MIRNCRNGAGKVSMTKRIGILALQGDFHKHADILINIGIEPVFVRYPGQLDDIEGLILPGGESTTMTKLLDSQGLHEPVRKFGWTRPVLGTCAGLIMLASEVDDNRIHPLSLLNIKVERNGFGRQVDSFTQDLLVTLDDRVVTIRTTFIRAPRIRNIGEGVSVIASLENEPVVVKSGNIIGMSFHPELDNVDIFHRYLFENKKSAEEHFNSEKLNAS